MKKDRIIYQDWIVELGYDPASGPPPAKPGSDKCRTRIIDAVTQAVDSLEQDEADFIRRFHYQGMGYREISRLTGRAIYRLEVLHQRALRKLKVRLPALLEGCCNLPTDPISDCPICAHPALDTINALILSKKEKETWKRIIQTLKNKYGLIIKTPQRLIGHKKYHMIEKE